MKVYHDVFVEQLVRRYRPGGEGLFKAGVIFIGLILMAAAFLLVRSFFPVTFAVIVILEFFAFVYTRKEFEYSFINGDVDIDMIQGKRKRSSVFSGSCRDIVTMAPCGDKPEIAGSFTRTLDASEGGKAADRWYFICERQDGTRELIYLSPNERLLDAFKGALGRKMEYTIPAEHTDTAE